MRPGRAPKHSSPMKLQRTTRATNEILLFLSPPDGLPAGSVVLLLGVMLAASHASADPSPIKLAVFDFELDDFSAGGGIAGDKAADTEQLNRAANEARRLIGAITALRAC